jgi:hypothetical protein
MFLLLLALSPVCLLYGRGGVVNETKIKDIIQNLIRIHGENNRDRIRMGVQQVVSFWQDRDGSPEDFSTFCVQHFIADKSELDLEFERIENNIESLYGHLHEINRDLTRAVQLDIGPLSRLDYLWAEYDVYAHILDDLYKTKIAFVVLLNFPRHTLEELQKEAELWDRKQWAQTRLAQKFSHRLPATINQELNRVMVRADDYVSNYNIYMDNVLDESGESPFPENLKLISHWGLRDELKAQYGQENGLVRQRLIRLVMERIIRQEIPAVIIDNADAGWKPGSNKIITGERSISSPSEPETRYSHILDVFKMEQKIDPFYPDYKNKIERRFNGDREIFEREFENYITAIIKDPVAVKVARLIERELGRKLEPFDIWYNGFTPNRSMDEKALDKIVAQRYPSAEAFQKHLPVILRKLDFDDPLADFLASKIIVDASRGVGHAMGAERRADNAHLRTRISKRGMNYKGYNIAIHELGHNVEQVLSLNKIDHYLLKGVPNSAFTEAFAYIFQTRDLEVLGLAKPDTLSRYRKALDTYWATCEIGAVGLLDVRMWHWLYDHPDASPAKLKDAVIKISMEVWNETFAPVIGIRDQILLAVYSHMINYPLYLPDYSIGKIIMFQIEDYLQNKNLGTEMERMCKLGDITPDAWMKQAVGSPISVSPLLAATRNAINGLN